MKQPPYLKPGDKVAITAPAGKVDQTKVKGAAKILKSWDLEVIEGVTTKSEHNFFSANDEVRAGELQTYLNDTSIKAIFSARGGYGSIRVLPYLNFSSFKKSPKWLVGFSDITIFHAYLNSVLDIASIHGTMASRFELNNAEESLRSLRDCLFGAPVEYTWKSEKFIRTGKTDALIVGGNLSNMCSLIDTPYEYFIDGCVLFIEDIDEHLYQVDRMLQQLKLGGVFKRIKGLIVGKFTDIKDTESPFGMSLEEIIGEAVSNYGFPVAFGFNAGHEEPNLALKLGSTVRFEVSEEVSKLVFL
jgi:muramoyltetrapeptide carboxypeptidase